MKRIPISAAKRIAEDYGYDQVVIYARKVGQDPEPQTGKPTSGEHMTTYGVTRVHCQVAARMAEVLQNFMGWKTGVIDKERYSG